jgi:excisionase family DNA binding protein
MTTADAAAALGITTRAVQLAIRRGTLAAAKVGRDYHVAADAVDRYRRDHAGRAGRPRKTNAPPE